MFSTKLPTTADTSRFDLAGAIAAGVCAGAESAVIRALYHEVTLVAYARWTFLAIAAYFTVASAAQRFWPNELRRIVPVWLLTAFFGSVFYVAGKLLPAVIKGWYHPFTESSLGEYISRELSAASSVVLLLLFITIPVTATFHYAAHIIRGIKAWREGPIPLSIVSSTPIKKEYVSDNQPRNSFI